MRLGRAVLSGCRRRLAGGPSVQAAPLRVRARRLCTGPKDSADGAKGPHHSGLGRVEEHDDVSLLFDDPEMVWVLPPIFNPFRGYSTPLNQIRIKFQYDRDFDLYAVHQGARLAYLTVSECLFHKDWARLSPLVEPSVQESLYSSTLQRWGCIEFFTHLLSRMSEVKPGCRLFQVQDSDIIMSSPVETNVVSYPALGPTIEVKFSFLSLRDRKEDEKFTQNFFGSENVGRLSACNIVLRRMATVKDEKDANWSVGNLNYFKPKGFFKTI